MEPDLTKLQRRLEYSFKDSNWLVLALTHRSKSKANYERLEFLGDSFLGFVASDLLYKKFPDQPEGVLTRLRANVVRQKSLASLAKSYELSDYLILGAGEGRSGGYQRDSILSDCLEAIIAAIYLDAGVVEARAFIERALMPAINALDPTVQLKDPKSSLQEWLQKKGFEVPDYQVSTVSGKDHKQMFEVECRTEISAHVFTGKGASRRKAEQKAAKRALDTLKSDYPND